MESTIKSLKLVSDPTRLRILSLLNQDPLTVAELQEILGMGQSRISTQLSQLKAAGLVIDERSGKNNVYSASLPVTLLPITLQAAGEIPEVSTDNVALRHILAKRKDYARAYFDELAGRFGKDYVPGRSWKALAEALIKVLNYRDVADLGAGEGTLSQLLAQRAEKVIAIDLSPKMVDYAQKLAIANGLSNLEFRIGDIENPPIDEASIDLAILSQALHHAENPQRAIDSAFRILRPGGRLIILDLLQHNFSKARELYADRWLGFSESQIHSMLEKSGFSSIETLIADKEETSPKFQTLLAICRR
ncbi:MAG: metalloregulator ArsR/SmtB family transcription factor [Akkermansiaceae bacterium]|nr:metalloregulator ArsR/SmtB family transcription factor [Akkermansiaceae bacterium]